MFIFMWREPTSARDSEALPSNTHYGMAGGSKTKGYRWGQTHEICETEEPLCTVRLQPLRPFLGRKFR